MRMHRALTLLLVLGAAGACTDADVFLPKVEPLPKEEVQSNRLKGVFCTEDPETIVFPLKVWMVIDDSGSMADNDANRRRYTAVQELATKLGAPGKVFLGGQVFSGQRTQRFSNPRFTDDVAAFNAQVEATSGPGAGETPYLGALNLTLSELTADVNEDPAKAKRTRYVIIFLSDGNPTDSNESSILGAVESAMALKSQTGGVTLNTVYLGGGEDGTGVILQNMAQKGEGQFKSFPNGDALDYSGFDFSSIRRTYVHRFFLVTNRSMLPTETGQEVDSDADGLSDAEESALGTSPAQRDTDSDGCNDALEVRVDWDPKAKVAGQCTCTAGLAGKDSDADWLNDCEESWIGTRSDDPDSDIGKVTQTDGDLVPDELDFTVLQDATFPNASSDQDFDGVLDVEELRRHTSVSKIDKDRRRWEYDYALFERQVDEPRCFDFEIRNLTLGRTLATAERAAGENVIELYFAQSSQDDPHKDRLYRVATKVVPFAEGGQIVRVEATDFDRLLGAP